MSRPFSDEDYASFEAIRQTVLKQQRDGQTIRLKDVQNIQLEVFLEIARICDLHQIPYFLEAGTLLGAARHGGFIPWDDDLDIDILRSDYERLVAALTNDLDQTRFSFHCIENNKYHNVTIPAIKVRRKNTYCPEPFHFAANHTGQDGLFVDVFTFDYCSPTDTKRLKKFRRKQLRSAILLSGLMLLHIHPKWLKKRHINNALKYHQKYQNGTHLCSLLTWVYTASWMYKIEDIFPLTTLSFEGYEVKVPGNYHQILTEHFGDYMALPPMKARRFRHINTKKLKIDVDVAALALEIEKR